MPPELVESVINSRSAECEKLMFNIFLRIQEKRELVKNESEKNKKVMKRKKKSKVSRESAETEVKEKILFKPDKESLASVKKAVEEASGKVDKSVGQLKASPETDCIDVSWVYSIYIVVLKIPQSHIRKTSSKEELKMPKISLDTFFSDNVMQQYETEKASSLRKPYIGMDIKLGVSTLEELLVDPLTKSSEKISKKTLSDDLDAFLNENIGFYTNKLAEKESLSENKDEEIQQPALETTSSNEDIEELQLPVYKSSTLERRASESEQNTTRILGSETLDFDSTPIEFIYRERPRNEIRRLLRHTCSPSFYAHDDTAYQPKSRAENSIVLNRDHTNYRSLLSKTFISRRKLRLELLSFRQEKERKEEEEEELGDEEGVEDEVVEISMPEGDGENEICFLRKFMDNTAGKECES